MEFRNGDQEYWRCIGAPQWPSHEVPRSLQASTQYGQGMLTGSQFTPNLRTALNGQLNFQHSFQGPSRTMTGVETEMSQLPAPYPEAYAEVAHRPGPTVALDQDTFSTYRPVGSFPSRNIARDSRIGNTFDHSSEPWMWPQGDPHGQQAYSFDSDSFRISDNGANGQPEDSYTTPPGLQWADPPFPRTPSPGNGNHDSPGLPGTPYRERMRNYSAEEGPFIPGILTWSLDMPFTSRNGHIQMTQETESSTQGYYPHGQSFLLQLGGTRPLSWSCEEGRSKTSPPSAGRIEGLLTRSVLYSCRKWYRCPSLPSSHSS